MGTALADLKNSTAAKKIVDFVKSPTKTPVKSPGSESPHPATTTEKKRRKLYKSDISVPFDCPPHTVSRN